jgi:hypothetical protein
MKKMTLILILLASIFTASAQNSKPSITKFYGEMGAGPTNYEGGGGAFSLRTVLSNKWTFGVSYQNLTMDAHNQPKDYHPGIIWLLILPIPDIVPTIDMSVISLTAGRVFPAGRKVWFTADAGLSFVSGQEVQFTPQRVTGSYPHQSSNYLTSVKDKSSLGGLLKADFNWALTRFMGLGAGAFANINGIQSPVGFQLKLIIGKMGIKG